MDCHSNHSVFLRSNGSLACWDDGGSRLTLKAFDPEVDYARDVVFGPVFAGLRDSLRRGEMPFPDYCRDCMVMASGACFNPAWAAKKEILIFQVEPSIACTLECPGCMTFAERKSRHAKPWNLDIAIFEKYLADFRNFGVSIRTIDFQGHGEPLLNRDVWKMAGLAKSYFPAAKVSMCTNAHGTYAPEQVHSGIDEMMFAIDGVDQPGFELNRVRGNFARAYAYMRDFCHGAAAEGRKIRTIWKYILYDGNNSPAQMGQAQEMAAAAAVQELLFVNTQLGLKSSRFYTLEEIPRAGTAVQIRVSGYFSSFHDMLHAVDKARMALAAGDAKAAAAHLAFAANMMRRRHECLAPGDPVPGDDQALILEILDLARDSRLNPSVAAGIEGGLHALTGRLTLEIGAAKRQIILWKQEEIAHLALQAGAAGRQEPRLWLKARLALMDVPAMNRMIRRQSETILKLAVRLDLQPGPGVSVL